MITARLSTRQDPAGAGHFGAPRGDRTHKGQDYCCLPGAEILAPVPDGQVWSVSKWGYPYTDGYGGVSRRIDFLAPQSQKIRSGAGSPVNFTIRDNIETDRTVSGTITLEYYASLTPLSSSAGATTNGVLTRFPNIYLFGCLAQLYSFGQDTEEESKWRSKFERAILGANKRDRDGRYLAPAGRVRGSTP